MTKHYLNLTNGIEWLAEIQATTEPYGFLRIQSTTLERHDYLKLLGDLDHDLLLNLAVGNTCVVYDCGTNRPYSKTIYAGIPIIRYMLNRRWYGHQPNIAHRLTRNGMVGSNEAPYFDQIYRQLFEHAQTKDKVRVKTKLDYYKCFLGGSAVLLQGRSRSTSNDGNYLFYSALLNKKAGVTTSGNHPLGEGKDILRAQKEENNLTEICTF